MVAALFCISAVCTRFSVNPSYRKLKKLKYNTNLAQTTKYCYGPEYVPEKTEKRNPSRTETYSKNTDKRTRIGGMILPQKRSMQNLFQKYLLINGNQR